LPRGGFANKSLLPSVALPIQFVLPDFSRNSNEVTLSVLFFM